MNEVLIVENLNKKFSSFELSDVSFKVREGEIMDFVGPNDSGKTTTIKLMLDVLNLDSGMIKYWGKDVHANKEAINEHLGIVMDQTFLLASWNTCG